MGRERGRGGRRGKGTNTSALPGVVIRERDPTTNLAVREPSPNTTVGRGKTANKGKEILVGKAKPPMRFGNARLGEGVGNARLTRFAPRVGLPIPEVLFFLIM